MLSMLKHRIELTRKRQLAARDWGVRYRCVFAKHPELMRKVRNDLERAHRKLWMPLRRNVRLSTLRMCVNLSGAPSPYYVPEELYVNEIEPCLNRYASMAFLANKSVYGKWFAAAALPKCYIHDVDGRLLSNDYRQIDSAAAGCILDRIRYPVVIKPTIDSGGGRDVGFPNSRKELESLMRGRRNFVVQEIIRQHEFFANLNAGAGKGVNTLRVCVYRSVADDSLHILNVALRMGQAGTLDNDAAGGIACAVDETGRLRAYGVDKYGGKHAVHPASGIRFHDVEAIPAFESLENFVLPLAEQVWLARLMSFDICMDASGAWRLIEVNLRGQTIRFAQYGGRPFFGVFTAEVIDYCTKNPEWR